MSQMGAGQANRQTRVGIPLIFHHHIKLNFDPAIMGAANIITLLFCPIPSALRQNGIGHYVWRQDGESLTSLSPR